MMRWIVRSSLKSRGLVVAVAAVVLFLGITQLRDMPRDVLPEFVRPTVNVQTEALGLSAPEVEQLITVPLEQDLLNGVPFLDLIHSKSVPGMSSIELIFKKGTDLARARLVVNERLTQAVALPHVSLPPQMLQPLSSESRVMMIGLTSKSHSLIDMGVLARWTLRPRLMGVPGVANVAIWGQRERQLQVQVDPETLDERGVSLDQVISTTGNALWFSPLGRLEANTPGTGGFFDGPQQRLGIFHKSPITTQADLAKVAIEGTESAAAPALTLGDVANVVEDHQPLIGDAVLSKGPGLMLVVEKLPEANVMEVTKGVDEALRAMGPGLAGIQVDSSLFRPANYIAKSTHNVAKALLIGLALLVLLLLALLFEWRTALIAAVTTLLSMALAVIVLHLGGATINAMVMAGLVLAVVVVVGDSIVDTENIRRRLRLNAEAGDGSAHRRIEPNAVRDRCRVDGAVEHDLEAGIRGGLAADQPGRADRGGRTLPREEGGAQRSRHGRATCRKRPGVDRDRVHRAGPPCGGRAHPDNRCSLVPQQVNRRRRVDANQSGHAHGVHRSRERDGNRRVERLADAYVRPNRRVVYPRDRAGWNRVGSGLRREGQETERGDRDCCYRDPYRGADPAVRGGRDADRRDGRDRQRGGKLSQ